jgi:hypothetical protein
MLDRKRAMVYERGVINSNIVKIKSDLAGKTEKEYVPGSAGACIS